jgi:flagellar biosynthetic protein FlhB
MSDMERTEEATPKKRADAHDEGQVPRSQELTTAVLLFGSAVVLNTAGAGLGRDLYTLFGHSLASAGASDLGVEGLTRVVQEVGWKVVWMGSVFLLSMAGLSLAVAGVQGRGVLSAKPLANWKRLDPVANTKRLVGVQPWFELLKSLLKLAVVALAVRWALALAWPDLLALVQKAPMEVVEVGRRYVVRLLMIAGGASLVIGVLDYVYQVWQHDKGLRMTKEEVKQEMKQGEVDPMIRQRLRQIGRELARKQMFELVPTADVVVTNPTHIAVALKYEQGKDNAPLIVAMGQELVAEKIRKIAREHDVPIVENKPVARALWSSAEVGSEIPPDLYAAIIEIYAFIIRQRQAGLQGGRV